MVDAASRFAVVLEECLSRSHDAGPEFNGARRLFHGRGHCFAGFEWLVVDRFGATLLIACFGGDLAVAEALAALLAERIQGISGIAVQQRQGRSTRTDVVFGVVPEQVIVEEAGLKFLVQPLRNQNVGLFLDMAPTRAWLVEHVRGRRVLNLYSFTCAFSVAALAGGAAGGTARGAAHVVNNDMSRPALDWGRRNHELNDEDLRRISMLPHNLFKSWWKIRQLGPYGVVVIDPPTNQRGSFTAEKQYGQVLKRLPDLCEAGADIIACLNSPFLNGDFLNAQMSRWCPAARFQGAMPASADFPDRFPDRGLKIARFRYQP